MLVVLLATLKTPAFQVLELKKKKTRDKPSFAHGEQPSR